MISKCDIIVKRNGCQLNFRHVDDEFIDAFLYSLDCDPAIPTEIILVPVEEDSSDD